MDARVLLRWNTAGLPSEKVVTDAWLRMFVGGTVADDLDARLIADWFTWGPSCDASDVAEMIDDALTECGSACLLAAMEVSTYVDLPLANAAQRIARGPGAATELRLGVAVPQLCGDNLLITALSEVELQGPGLVVELCEPPSSP